MANEKVPATAPRTVARNSDGLEQEKPHEAVCAVDTGAPDPRDKEALAEWLKTARIPVVKCA